MANEAREQNYEPQPKETKVLGEDEYINNYNGVYTCVECGKDFLGRADSFICMSCLNKIHGD